MRRLCCCCFPAQQMSQKQNDNRQELIDQKQGQNNAQNFQKVLIAESQLMNNSFNSSKISKTVLVTGANGYIGRAVAIAFRRQGYQVFGIVRSKEKAEEAQLIQNEISPVIGDPNKAESFLMQLRQSGIIVECASSTDKPDLIKNLVNAVINSGLCEDNQRKLYIQTTGFQQYAHEHIVTKNNQIFGCVVRPAFVFGGEGGPLQKHLLFQKPKDGTFKTGIKKTNVWPWVQINDLAKAYTLIADKKNQVGGQIFRVGEINQQIIFEKLAIAAAEAMRVNIEFTDMPQGFENVINISIQEFDNSTSKILLQWQPNFACNPLLDMDTQYKCYLSWLGQFQIQEQFNSQKISKTVFVTGANGYIGRAVALAFKKLGYKVYGLVRNKEKADEAQLLQNEIIPIVGDPNAPQTFQQYLKQSGIIVECASSTDKPDLIKNLVEAVAQSGACEDNSKKIFIQTTGFQQYAHEAIVTQNNQIIGCVVRPAFVFGGQGGPLQKHLLFIKPQEGPLKTGIKKSNVWPWVQLHDLAKAYTKIASQKSQVQGQVFKVGELDKNITFEKVANAAAQAMKVDIEFTDQPQGFEHFINISIPDFENSNTKFILQWQPSFACNPILDMELQYKCYLSWLGQYQIQQFNSSKISKTVLVTGCNGYIGRAVALAFRRQGYFVYGVVRSEEKVEEAQLIQNEIIPVVADPNNPEQFMDKINMSGIIIECASSTDKPDLISNLVEAVCNSGLCEDNSKKLFIQTTGFQQYAHEHIVLKNNQIVGTVVRPAFVYGGQGGPIQRWFLFGKSEEGNLKSGIGRDKIWPWVHIQDLAKAYTLIALKKNQVEGQLFSVGEVDANITFEKVATASAKAMNVDVVFTDEPQGMEAMLNISIPVVDNKSTKELLKWVPDFPSNPLEDMEIQYKCYLSWLKQNQ